MRMLRARHIWNGLFKSFEEDILVQAAPYRAVLLLKWELRFCSSQTTRRIFKCFSHQLDFYFWLWVSYYHFTKFPQFLAQIWWICSFSRTSLPDPLFINLRVRTEAAAAHFVPLLPFFSSISFWENKMVAQKISYKLECHLKWKIWGFFANKNVIPVEK